MKRFAPLAVSLAITGVCLFASAGRLDWPNGWVLMGLSFATGLAFMAGRSAELTAERSHAKPGKSWDKAIVGFTVLLGPMTMWITAGLDNRFHWSSRMSDGAFAAGVAVAVLGAALTAWAMRSNEFFSTVVRIQKDRGHTVATGGPYRFVRHPGYTGMMAFLLATPLILESYWAFVPAVVTAAVNVLRTALEDRTLREELDGYEDYARKVRYKLLPAVW